MGDTVRNDLSGKRFEMEVAGSLAFLDYELEESAIALVHTEVPPELEGMGLGSKLVKAALDYAEAEGLKVIPQCPFVAKYIERHKEYGYLIQ
ncbi:N-acetyltransferase [Desulfuromonas versatilis]|uniref:N-acetyltransferase n=1 Tax=Desulfuromonas versatilis TaxID=2802975 RepID=A0ABM8HSB9_9BACT|nr:GNAT family N-acetyltransferase [Desulfuromonas versatilis]BCR04878.1 N-acetyltransferase [Desulfuromonas versatilis]